MIQRMKRQTKQRHSVQRDYGGIRSGWLARGIARHLTHDWGNFDIGAAFPNAKRVTLTIEAFDFDKWTANGPFSGHESAAYPTITREP